MSKPLPSEVAQGHPSGWVRLVIRTLSIRGATWVVFVLALVATTVVCEQAWRHQTEGRQVRFEADAAILRNAMIERLHGYVQVLQAAGGLFAASEVVEQAEFRSYVNSLELTRQYPGVLALGYAEMVEHGPGPGFSHEPVQNPGNPDSTIPVWPPGDRPDYFVVRYVEPLETNRITLGFDLGSEPTRRAAAMAARDTGYACLTSKLHLVQSPDKPGTILLKPVYSSGPIPTTAAERRARLQGWVYAAFLVGNMMEGVRQITQSTLEYEVYDGTTPSMDSLLCSSGTPELTGSWKSPTRESALSVYGQTWTVRIHPPVDQGHESAFLAVGLLAAGGGCMSLLVLGIAHSMATTGRRAIALAADMTAELRRQEEALRTSEERLAMVIEGSYDGIWDWDVTTGAVYFSPRWKSMLGYEDHEIENTFTSWEALVHPDDRARALEVVNRYFAGEIPNYQLEHRLRHRDGSYRWILARGVASRDPDGRPVRMAGSHVDLTELKAAEQDLRQANEDLLRSQAQLQRTLADLRASHDELEKTQLELIQAAKLESVGTLAAGVAHEVKNPLQIMIMGLDYLDQHLGGSDESTRITLNDMRDAALRADSITRELLQFSTASQFTPVPSNLGVVLEKSLWLTRTDLTKPRVHLVKKLADELPPVVIDPPKIQQVLINLILNALQAMNHAGTLTIVTAHGRLDQFLPSQRRGTTELRDDQPVVVLRLHDTGPGIPENQLPKIFDPFFTTKSVGSGTGLGLSVVKKILDLHGALIAVRNDPGGGFEVTIALAAASPAADKTPATPNLVAG